MGGGLRKSIFRPFKKLKSQMSCSVGASFVFPSTVCVRVVLIHEVGSEEAMPDLQQAHASLHASVFGTSASQGYNTQASVCELPAPLCLDKAQSLGRRPAQRPWWAACVPDNSRLVVTKEPSNVEPVSNVWQSSQFFLS